MAPPDIDLIEMANPAISRGDGDIFELYVHVVLGYSIDTEIVSMVSNILYQLRRISDMKLLGVDEPSINLPRYTWPDVISSVITWFYMQYISTFLGYAGIGVVYGILSYT